MEITIPDSQQSRLSSNRKCHQNLSKRQEYFCLNFLRNTKKNLSQLINQSFGHVYINILNQMTRKGLMEGLQENLPELEEPWPICLMNKALTLGSCFRWILRFSVLKASVDLPQFLWLYVLLFHTPLDTYQGIFFHLFTS